MKSEVVVQTVVCIVGVIFPSNSWNLRASFICLFTFKGPKIWHIQFEVDFFILHFKKIF